ncbi:homeobox-leucine zipper protein HAT14-like isoform X2 [Primulina eburnea]|uniref:homeobox-leucine zipper protein HAT14-like isoform X2 n=1 Tax=Primulina eburnea TaxID=1245227 RepID=UPI003C6C18C3
MELALSLGDTPKPFSLHEKSQKILGMDLGFCMAVEKDENNGGIGEETGYSESERRAPSSDPTVQLHLLPFSPVHRSQPPLNLVSEAAARGKKCEEWEATLSSSKNKSYQMDYFSTFKSKKRELEESTAADLGLITNSRGTSDEEENGLARKKLRLSKEQSAFLEDSFKEHNTLNPRQKLALAKELNLRPRQVEVWFQNRRARTKLKQTEVDYEYLKRCCETLTEENRKLQKELQELRALKATQPFYKQLPATTLTMCPSCERLAAPGAAPSKPVH